MQATLLEIILVKNSSLRLYIYKLFLYLLFFVLGIGSGIFALPVLSVGLLIRCIWEVLNFIGGDIRYNVEKSIKKVEREIVEIEKKQNGL